MSFSPTEESQLDVHPSERSSRAPRSAVHEVSWLCAPTHSSLYFLHHNSLWYNCLLRCIHSDLLSSKRAGTVHLMHSSVFCTCKLSAPVLEWVEKETGTQTIPLSISSRLVLRHTHTKMGDAQVPYVKGYYLYRTYVHPPVYLNSPLGYLQYLIII